MTTPSPVFVDPSGRRHRRAAVIGWALAGVLVAYLGLLIASLVAPPGSIHLSVPGIGGLISPVGPPALDGSGRAPGAVIASPSAAPTRTPGAGTGTPGTGPGQTPNPRPTPTPLTTPTQAGLPTPASTTAASARPTGRGTPHATQRPRPTPTPHSTRRP